MKVIGAKERVMETCYTLEIEYEGKVYTCNMYLSDNNSYTDWYDDNWKLITQPDWADDLDLWQLHNENMQESEAI